MGRPELLLFPQMKGLLDELNKQDIEESAKSLIDYFNEVMKSYGNPGRFRHSNHSLQYIRARLREGFTEDDIKLIIDYKSAEWLSNPETREWVNPVTLFRPTKIEKNLAAAKAWESGGKKLIWAKGYKGLRDKSDFDEFIG